MDFEGLMQQMELASAGAADSRQKALDAAVHGGQPSDPSQYCPGFDMLPTGAKTPSWLTHPSPCPKPSAAPPRPWKNRVGPASSSGGPWYDGSQQAAGADWGNDSSMDGASGDGAYVQPEAGNVSADGAYVKGWDKGWGKATDGGSDAWSGGWYSGGGWWSSNGWDDSSGGWGRSSGDEGDEGEAAAAYQWANRDQRRAGERYRPRFDHPEGLGGRYGQRGGGERSLWYSRYHRKCSEAARKGNMHLLSQWLRENPDPKGVITPSGLASGR